MPTEPELVSAVYYLRDKYNHCLSALIFEDESYCIFKFDESNIFGKHRFQKEMTEKGYSIHYLGGDYWSASIVSDSYRDTAIMGRIRYGQI